MQRIDFQPAYILHTRPYQETSLLLEIFTQDFGRIAAIAKGAKRPKSRGRGLLQPFTPLLVSCVGRSELLTLSHFDTRGMPHSLKGQQLISAFYLNELLMRLLHRSDTHSSLFLDYQKTLIALEKTTNEQAVLRIFEKNLLKAMGYELQLTHEVETHEPVQPENFYCFDPERGPSLVPNLKQSPGKSQDFIFPGKSLLALADETLKEPSVLLDAKRLMRRALSKHLGDKPLETRRLFL